SVPFGYLTTTVLLRGHLLRVRPDHFYTHGSSLSGTSRLLFSSGVRPLLVRPDYFSAQGSVVHFVYVPTTFRLMSHPFRVRPDHFYTHGSSLSGTSRLLFSSGVRPLLVRPDYFSAQGSVVHFVYVPTTFRLMSHPFRVRPDHFYTHGSSLSGTSRLLFSSGVRPLLVRPDYFSAQGSVVHFVYVPTTFRLMSHPFRVRPDHFYTHGSSLSGTSRLLFSSGVRPLLVRPDYFSAQGSVVHFVYVPTTFRLMSHPFRVRPDHFYTHGSSLSGTSRLHSCSGVRPLGVRPDYISAQGSVPFGYIPSTFLLRGPSPS
ncbi:hypothetical protein CRG98_005382, partial [Punica granatum]